MPEVPVAPDTDPMRRLPVPIGFPPRRTEEAPPLDEYQLPYVSSFSLYMEHYRFTWSSFLFTYQPPMVVFPLQAISGIFHALLAWAIAWWLYFMVRVHPEDKMSTGDAVTVVAVICALIFGFIFLANYGRSGRMNRWLRYQWDDYDFFARCEAWMQFVGFIDLISTLGTLAIFLVLFIRG
jgi:hypothetical protein